MKVTITKVNWKDVDKEGNKLISQKSGKPYYKVGIQCNEFGDKWINGITSFIPNDWEGKEKELEIVDDPKWGKQFKLAPRAPMGGMSEGDRLLISRADGNATEALKQIHEMRGIVSDLLRRLTLAKVPEFTSDGKEMPNFDKPVETNDEPPLTAYDE